MDHHLMLLSSLCIRVCILSDEMTKRHPIITAVMICLECSWGYGYVCVRIVRTLSILSVPNSGLPLCLSEPIKECCFEYYRDFSQRNAVHNAPYVFLRVCNLQNKLMLCVYHTLSDFSKRRSWSMNLGTAKVHDWLSYGCSFEDKQYQVVMINC